MGLNIPLFETLLTWLDAGAPEADNNGFGFNMRDYIAGKTTDTNGHWCNSTCCIAGFGVMQDPDFAINANRVSYVGFEGETINLFDAAGGNIYDRAIRAFGLTGLQACSLFCPSDQECKMEYVAITPAMAAVAVRNLLDTGEVKWN